MLTLKTKSKSNTPKLRKLFGQVWEIMMRNNMILILPCYLRGYVQLTTRSQQQCLPVTPPAQNTYGLKLLGRRYPLFTLPQNYCGGLGVSLKLMESHTGEIYTSIIAILKTKLSTRKPNPGAN